MDATEDDYLTLSLLATEDGHAATIIYAHETRGEGEHEDLRTLSALHVYRRNGVGYVTAYDDLSGERRTFRIDRMAIIGTWTGLGAEARRGELERKARTNAHERTGRLVGERVA